MFSIYRRYDETIIYQKPADTNMNQKKISDDSDGKNKNNHENNLYKNQQKTTDNLSADADTVPASSESPQDSTPPADAQGENHFTIYSVGDVYTAENGQSELQCDVRNTEDSTHDIIMSIYLTEEELKNHNIKTDKVEGGQWLIAQTGMFEPGYQITSVQLLALPDGSYLPAGTYSAIMNEKYYHHLNGTLSSYEANIPVTLEVAS